VYSALARAAQAKFVAVLKPNVKITSGESPIDYKKWYMNCIADYAFEQFNKLSADAKEWDTSMNIVNHIWEAETMHCVLFNQKLTPEMLTHVIETEKLANAYFNFWKRKKDVVSHQEFTSPLSIRGMCSSWVVEMYLCDNVEWKMVLKTNKGSATLTGKSKQFSGKQNTLYGNSQNNMAQIGAMLIIHILIVAMFQGDDSYVNGDYEIDRIEFEKLLRRGMIYEIGETTGPSEYVGYVIHEKGWMPDVYRRGANCFSRLWSSKEKYEESIIGLKDVWSIVETQEEAVAGLAASARYYEENTDLNTNLGHLTNLYNWQIDIMSTPWSALKDREMYPFCGEAC